MFPDYQVADIALGVLNEFQLDDSVRKHEASPGPPWSVPFLGINRDGDDFTVLFDGVPTSDEQTAVDGLVASHIATPAVVVSAQSAVFIDDESGLVPLVPSATALADKLVVARDASQTGVKFFAFDGSTPVPIVGIGPSCTLELPTGVSGSVPSGATNVIGGLDFCATLERTFRFPGDDTGSPFATMFGFSLGEITGIPPGRARMGLNFLALGIEPAEWEICLQKKPVSGSWADDQAVWSCDFSFTATPLSKWSGAGINQFDVTAGDTFRLVIRHNHASARRFDVHKMLIAINSVGVQT